MKYLVVVMLVVGSFQPLWAGHLDMDHLLTDIKQSRNQENKINQQREAKFVAEKNQQAHKLSKSRGQLSAEKGRGNTLKATFEANEEEITALQLALKEKAGELGELFGVVRQVAGDTKAVIDTSLISAQFPGRSEKLEAIAKNAEVPSIQQLESLWYLIQQEMTEQGKTVKFTGKVISAPGEPRETEIIRVGPFNLFADGLYIKYLSETSEMVEYVRQPAGRYLSLAESLSDAESGIVGVGIDPTGGVILSMLVQAPGVMERIEQGGAIGYIILALGLVGLVVVVLRMVDLFKVGQRVDAQLGDLSNIQEDNPLGRVVAASKAHPVDDLESFELIVDEAVGREIPILETGQSLVKLLAAVAPLLGLLGTVTGMIETFQSISLFGTGDPKLMAGGISQALVTTMLGLMVAIPLLFLHSLMLTRSKRLIQILDEQSSGLICQNLQMEKD